MRDARYEVVDYLKSNMNGREVEINLCSKCQLIEVRENNTPCYVGADEWTLKNGNVVVLGAGKLRNDIERCLARGRYNIMP